MSSIEEEDLYWANEVEKLHHDALKNVREAATKWQAAIAAALGAFVTVGFVWGPDKFEKYPIGPGLWRGLSLFLMIAAGAAGLTAAVYAGLAGIGIPKEYPTMTGPDLEQWTQAQAKKSMEHLDKTMHLAFTAGVLALAFSVWLMIAAATAAPKPQSVYALLTGKPGPTCAKLVKTDTGGLAIEVDGAKTELNEKSKFEIVDACP